MADSNINEIIHEKCERCQIDDASIICHSCQPFHKFCHRCDSIIHSLKIKSNHVRESLLQNNLNESKNIKINNPEFEIYQKSFTPERQFIRTSFIENNLNKKYDINTYNPQNYSENYIKEIKRINEKEKDAMRYKIESLQNYIEKLKNNFQKELKNIEDKANQYLNEKKVLEEKLNNIIEKTLKEKNLKINIISKENEHLKEKTKLLEEQIKETNEKVRKKEIEYNNYVDNLKEEITSTRKENITLQKNHMNKFSEIVKINDNNLKDVEEKHKKEINDIYFDCKTKNDKLIEQVQNDYNTIEMLKNNNNNLQQLIQKLESNNDLLIKENKELKNKNNALINNLKSSYNINENLKKNMQKIKIENNNMKDDFDYFESTINGLKNEIILMKETSIKKDQDFDYLLSQSEKIRKEFSENMFNNEELDLRNRRLIKENEELKKALLSFQETINI